MAETKTILVAGATGQQGGAVGRELMKRGHRVIGLTRSTSKFKDLATAGIEGVQGDLTDRTSLAPLLRNADGFFIVTTPFEPDFSVHPEREVQQGTNAIDVGDLGDLRRVDRVRPLLHLSLRVDGEVGFEGRCDDEEPVRVPKERSETRSVCQVSLNSFDAGRREVLEFRCAPREADHSMSSLHKLPRDRPALLPGRSRDQDRFGLSHFISPRGPRTSAVLVGWTL